MKLFFLSVLLCLLTASAFAGVDDYPTSIAGCQQCDSRGNAYGPIITGDLKDVTQDSLIDPWRLYNRECTSFCAWRLQSRNGYIIAKAYGYAQDWGASARNDGYTVDKNPVVGAIAWWYFSAKSGHVAWVEAVNGSSVTIEEYNYDLTGHYKEAVINADSVNGYIHFKDITAVSDPANIYVSLSGSDASNGSASNPFRTIKHAIDMASAGGATIYIAPGSYGEKNSSSGKHIHFVVNGTGSVQTGG